MSRRGMLFHSTLGFPKGAQLTFGTKVLYWTKNALSECSADLPQQLDTDTAQVIEAELTRLDDGSFYTNKVLYRIPYTETKDLFIGFSPASGAVKTAWIRKKEDSPPKPDNLRYWTPEGVDWFYSGQFGRAPPRR